MVTLRELVGRLGNLASEHEMDLALVGASITTTADLVDQIDDYGRPYSGRLVKASTPTAYDPTLKITPKGVPSRLLLEIDANFRLVRHHNLEVTRLHAGKKVSEDWVRRFIEACRPIAHQLIEAAATALPPAHCLTTIPGQHGVHRAPAFLPELVPSSKPCRCGGRNEQCYYCYGTGWT